MQVLAILLLILKIIGIIILSLLGVVILLLAILLFAPAIYKADGSFKDESYCVDGVLYWLIVKVKYIIDDKNEGKLEVIFPFGIGSEEHKRKKEAKEKLRRAKLKKAERTKREKAKAKEEQKKAKNSDEDKVAISEKKEQNITQNKANDKPSDEKNVKEKAKKTAEEKKSNEFESSESEVSIFEKTVKFFQKAKNKMVTLIQKPKQIYKEVMDFIAQIREMNEKYNFKAVTKETFLFLKRFFTALGLKKFEICGIIGLEDPADTGQLLAAISMATAFIPIKNDIAGDFQNKNMDLTAVLKGRTTLFAVIYAVLRYVLSESILPLVKDYTK